MKIKLENNNTVNSSLVCETRSVQTMDQRKSSMTSYTEYSSSKILNVWGSEPFFISFGGFPDGMLQILIAKFTRLFVLLYF